MIYTAFLVLHSWLRWVALGLLIASLIFAAKKDDGPTARRLSVFTIIGFDLQALFGLMLYAFLSPVTKSAFADFGAAMKNSGVRFFAVEHIFGMIIAVALVHVGHALAKKAADGAAAAKKRLVFFSLGLVVAFLSIPWPFYPAARPLFRLFGG